MRVAGHETCQELLARLQTLLRGALVLGLSQCHTDRPPPCLPQSDKVDLREYHYDMIKFKGLGEHHHELMCKHFQEVLDELGNCLPAETKTGAIAAMRAQRTHFRPVGAECEAHACEAQPPPQGPGWAGGLVG